MLVSILYIIKAKAKEEKINGKISFEISYTEVE